MALQAGSFCGFLGSWFSDKFDGFSSDSPRVNKLFVANSYKRLFLGYYFLMQFGNIYNRKDYKRLLILPLLLVFISLLLVPRIPLGIDFRGGTLFTVYVDGQHDLDPFKAQLQARLARISPDATVRKFDTPTGKGLEIELQANAQLDEAGAQLAGIKGTGDKLLSEDSRLGAFNSTDDPATVNAQKQKVAALEKQVLGESNALLLKIGSAKRATDASTAAQLAEDEYVEKKSAFRGEALSIIKSVVPVSKYSSKEIGASLSKFFLSKTTEILLMSFAASAIVVFFVFRSFVPSLAVLFGAFADIAMTLGAMGLFQIPLSLATVAALLMLIGFSLDTDMLLTIRALKRTEETVRDRVNNAMKTAMLMNATTVAAFGVLLIVSNVLQIQTYYQIALVAVIGGIVDFIATWAGNAVIVIWYADSKK